MREGVDQWCRHVVEGDLAAIRRPFEGADGKAVSPSQAAGLRALLHVRHPEVRHAEVGVFDSVVAVMFLALFEVVGCGVDGRVGDPGAVGRKAERANSVFVGSEPLGLAAHRRDKVDLRAVAPIGHEAQAGSVG